MRLEHVNITVTDPKQSADLFCRLFDWSIRWEGPAIANGYTVHVGTGTDYVALYAPNKDLSPQGESYSLIGGLNHVGIVVDDIDDIEDRVRKAGLTPHNHADYEPGKRFYFDTPDGVEVEVVSYS